MLKKIPAVFWIWLLPVVLGLPFIGRTYFVDDHYHVLMARGLLEHPGRPYDFRADDAGWDNAGWERGQPPRMVNPPGHHYLLAAFWKLGGGRLWAVRLGSLMVAAFAAVFLYLIAGRLMIPPGIAAGLAVLTPAFWLTSYSLLIDSTLLTFFLGSLWFWMSGLEARSWARLGLSGLLMALTLWTKYTGLFVGGLCLLWWWEQKDRWRAALWTFLIPAAAFGLWTFWTWRVYGGSHFLESSRRVVQTFHASHLIIILTFFSGALIFPLWAWADFPWKNARARIAGLLAAGGFMILLAGPWGGFSLGEAAAMTLFILSGALFILQAVKTGLRSRVGSDRFLVWWLLLGLAQMAAVMQWVAARYYLTLLPPAVFLALRGWREKLRFAGENRRRREAVVLAALFLCGAALAAGDYLQAETRRAIVRDLLRDGWLQNGRRGFSLEDSFAGGDLKAAGWRPAFPETALVPGDLILCQEVIMPPWWFHPRALVPLRVYEYHSAWPLRLMDNRGSAGFYASAWGALPFVWSRGPLERFTLYEIPQAK